MRLAYIGWEYSGFAIQDPPKVTIEVSKTTMCMIQSLIRMMQVNGDFIVMLHDVMKLCVSTCMYQVWYGILSHSLAIYEIGINSSLTELPI